MLDEVEDELLEPDCCTVELLVLVLLWLDLLDELELDVTCTVLLLVLEETLLELELEDRLLDEELEEETKSPEFPKKHTSTSMDPDCPWY